MMLWRIQGRFRFSGRGLAQEETNIATKATTVSSAMQKQEDASPFHETLLIVRIIRNPDIPRR